MKLPSNKAGNLAEVQTDEGRLLLHELAGNFISAGNVPLISEAIGCRNW